MRRRRDNIEIQEPPLREIKKKHSCFRRSCTTGCGCFLIIILGFLLFFKFFVVSQPKKIKTIPDNFPRSVPIYDSEHIDNIFQTLGKKRNKLLYNFGYLSQKSFSPIFKFFDNNKKIYNTATKIKFDDVFNFISNPTTLRYDTIKIEWQNLTAEPDFIQKFFSARLESNGFFVSEGYTKEGTYDLSFENETINGDLHIDDNPKKNGSDYISITVRFPAQ